MREKLIPKYYDGAVINAANPLGYYSSSNQEIGASGTGYGMQYLGGLLNEQLGGEWGNALGSVVGGLGESIVQSGDIKSGLKSFIGKDMFSKSNMSKFGTKDFGGFGKAANLGMGIASGILDRSTSHQRTSGKYGSLASMTDMGGGLLGQFGKYGNSYSAIAQLAMSGVNKLTGGTDGMTVADSLLGSSSLAGGLAAINPFAGGAYIALSGINSATGKTTIDNEGKDFMSQEELASIGGSYGKSMSDHEDALQYGGKKYGGFSVLAGSFGKANNKIKDDNRRVKTMLDIYDRAELGKIRGSMSDINQIDWRLLSQGGYNQYGTYIGRKGMKLPTKEDIEKIRNVLKQDKINSFKKGGQMNVIPEGALHARLHHMENGDKITKKGIPVVDKSGEQQAEIERDEIIFSLDVTTKLEALRKDGSDKAAIKAGKLLVDEIFNNTDDRTGLIADVIGKEEAQKGVFKQGGILTVEEPEIYSEIEAEEPPGIEEVEYYKSGGVIIAEEPKIEIYKEGGKKKKTPRQVWAILNADDNFDDGFIDEPEYDDDLKYESLPESIKEKITEEEWEDFLDDMYHMQELVDEAKKQNPRFIQRLSEEPRGIDFIDDMGNAVRGSHYLSSGEDDFGGYVFPRIQEQPDGSLKFFRNSDEALRQARNNNNILRFESPMDAFRFSTRYKRFFPEFFQKFK